MRRAALAAIVLVAALLLLLPRGSGASRSTRSDPPPPVTFDPPAADSPPAAESNARPENEPAADRPTAVASGIVANEMGTPVGRIGLRAIPDDPAGREETAVSDKRGAFVFRGLPNGTYRLEVDGDWMLTEPVPFRADTRGLRATVAAAWPITLKVLDLDTGKPIPRFEVRYRWPPNGADRRIGQVVDGAFRTRLEMSYGSRCVFEIEADGYYGGTGDAYANSPGIAWLARRAEPLTVLRVQFEDGAPCEEEASVCLSGEGSRQATVPAVCDQGGLYRVAIPAGAWKIDFRPRRSEVFRKSCTADVEIVEGEPSEVFLKLARGGDILVTRRDWDGKPWVLTVFRRRGSAVTAVLGVVCAEGPTYELRHLEPGSYTVTGELDGSDEAIWRSEIIEVTTGSRHELTIE